jgi:cytochrome P450
MVTKMVAERFPSEANGFEAVHKPDMLQSFIKHGIPREEAVHECIITIMGGSDTMSIAVRSTMLFIMTNPYVYFKLQAEIEDFVKARFFRVPVVSDSDARNLPYLNSVIREGLRCLPPG